MTNYAALFDLDGTLINSLSDIAAVVNLVRDLYSLPPLDIEFIRGSIGKGTEYLLKRCFSEAGPEKFPEILLKHRELYLKYPHISGEVYEGVVETLQRLQSNDGLKIGVATNKPKQIALLTLKHYLPGIRFDAIYGPEDVTKKKPDPAHLLETLAFLKVTPEKAIYCGDDPVDLKASEAAGILFLGAGWGFGGVKANGSQHLTKFEQILPWVEKLLV